MTLTPVALSDLDALHGLSVEVDWPHRVDDWRLGLEVGRGFAARDETGTIGGCALWFPYGEAAAAIGMVIVSPRLQGRGTGTRLMQEILAEAGARRLSLNATAAGLRLYEAMGFAAEGAIRQHQGMVSSGASAAPDPRVRRMTEADLGAVRALDADATGVDRGHLLDRLAGSASGQVFDDGVPRAFAFVRSFGRGRLVGPLVSRDDAMAEALLRPVLNRHAGTFMRVDTAIADGPFPALLAAHGLTVVGGGITMVRGGRGDRPATSRTFALASQAFG